MWNTSSRSKPKPADAWNKAVQHDRIEQQRNLIESGYFDGKPRPPSPFMTALGVLLITAAFALGVFGILELRKWQTGGEWPTVTATVTDTSIKQYWDDRQTKYKYRIVSIYTYSVNGKIYRYSESGFDYNYIEVADKHRADTFGQQKTLWYNPDSPDQNTFFPMVAVLTLVSIVGAVVTLIIGIYFYLRGTPAKQPT